MATPLPVHPVLGPTAFPVHAVDPVNTWTTYVFPLIGTTTGVIAAFAALAALRGLLYAHKTYQLTKRQVDADEALRALKPRLVVREQRSARNGKGEMEASVPLIHGLNSLMLIMELENEGNHKATNMSVEFLMEGIKGVGMDRSIAVTSSGYTKNRVPGELAPGEKTIIGNIDGSADPGVVRIKWIARCNEGSFPQKDDPASDPWGELIFRLGKP